MKEWKKLTIMMSAMFVTAYLLAGCGSGDIGVSVDTNTVSIKKDGTIEHMIIDKLDKDYYNIDELAAKAQKKIDGYNDGTDNIVLKSAEEKDDGIIVKMIYKTAADYAQFNRRECFYGTVAEASAKGFSIRNLFSEDGTALNDTEQIWENHVVIIQTKEGEELDVNVYGEILYTSDNISRSGKNDVVIPAGKEAMISYIVFK